MRQTHIAGEKMFVDYCGPTMEVINPDTGEMRKAQIFVAVLGALSAVGAAASCEPTPRSSSTGSGAASGTHRRPSR